MFSSTVKSPIETESLRHVSDLIFHGVGILETS